VSLGALADSGFLQIREEKAIEGKSKLHLASGTIGALDCLRATLVGGL
jgi:aspartate dehydrogenase